MLVINYTIPIVEIASQVYKESLKYYLGGADEGDKKFDENFFKKELKEMQDRCIENQKIMQRIENKYFKSNKSK